MSDFLIAQTKTFEKAKVTIEPKLYAKIKNIVYPQLRQNPYFGTNIKKLKGELDGYYRYRLGSYRLFYAADGEKVIIFVVDIRQRKDAY